MCYNYHLFANVIQKVHVNYLDQYNDAFIFPHYIGCIPIVQWSNHSTP